MKADGSLKSLLQGVSQQPTRDRLPGQCTEQINMSSDPVQGLCRRPGDDLVARLSNVEARHWFDLITPDGQRFLGKVVLGGIEMYNLNGVQFPVVNNSTASYWGPGTNVRWRSITIKDRTFIANTNITVRMRAEYGEYANAGVGAGAWRPGAIIQFLGGTYGRVYRVYLNGTEVAAYQTPDGSSGQHSQYVGAEYLAKVLRWLLENPAGTTPPAWIYVSGGGAEIVTHTGAMSTGYTFRRAGDILTIRKDNQSSFGLTVSDDSGLTTMKALVDTVPDIADLPRFAPNKYIVRVAQEADPLEDLWMEFRVEGVTAANSGFGLAGAWYEAVAPGASLGFDKSRMPKIMTFDGTTFTISESEWEDRTTGTDTTNPLPSFVNSRIRDLGMFQGRLIILSSNSLAGSRVNKQLNFWMGSASTIKDTDPIDISSQAAYADVLRWIVPHNKDLVIFSERGQFIMFGRTAATPSNAALVLTTSFEADLDARPVPAGRNVFFATQFGQYTGIREFYTEGGSDINDTRPVTQHVKKYIQGSVTHMSSTSSYDKLFVHTDADPTKVYAYEYIWADQEKVQSSWSRWEFDTPITHSFFDFEQVYWIRRRPTGHYILSRMSLDNPEEAGAGYPVHLAERWDVFNVSNEFIIPYWFLGNEEITVIQGEGCPHPGMPAAILSAEIVGSPGMEEWHVTLREDMQGGNILGGATYNSEYWPSMPRLRDGAGDVIGNARLQINQFVVQTEDSVHMVGQKMAKWGNGPQVGFFGYSVNSPETIIGEPPLGDYQYRVPFKDKTDRAELRLFTRRHWPLSISEIEYEGTVNKRGKRITSGDR